jgi:hypothetical protein
MESISEIASGSVSDRRRLRSSRSRITNGALFADGRSSWARRARDLINEFVNEQLAGIDNCSPAERAIVRRIATLITELERLESKFAAKDEATPAQLLLYGRTANTLRRLLESIGLQRRSRNLNPKLDDLLLEHQQRAAAVNEVADG